METLKSLLDNWVDREPVAILWLAVVSVLFFGIIFARSHDNDERADIWVRHLLESLSKTIVFVGLIGMAYFLLTSNYATFSNIYGSFLVDGSLSNRAWQNKRNDMNGTAYIQQDLQVTQYVTLETEEIIQPEDATAPPLYRNATVEQAITQNSIAGFEGLVQIVMDDSVHQPDVFHTYTLFANYRYDIVNPMDVETHAKFKFPLSADTMLYQDINIEIDGETIPYWYIDAGVVIWDRQMNPRDKQTVSIQFITKGMDSFAFEVVEPREITDFKLEVKFNTPYFVVRTEPNNGGIQLDDTIESQYRILSWVIDHAVAAPRLRIDFIQGWPYAPFHEMIVMLLFAARASMLFLSLAVLTSLIFGSPINLQQVALLAGSYVIPYLIIMSGGGSMLELVAKDSLAGFQVKMLPLISILPLIFAFFILRKHPNFMSVLLVVLMALFMIGYPFIGLLPDEQKRNVTEGAVQIAMIVYVFILTFIMRVRNLSKRPSGMLSEKLIP